VEPDQSLIVELAQWFDTPPGQVVQRWEQMQVDRIVENVFGYYAFQIGMPQWDLLAANRILHKGRSHALFVVGGDTQHIALVTEPEQLPFAAHSVDLLILPHVLECSSAPHAILREAERVLVAEGRLVITGFNPWSLWGARQRLPGLEPLMPTPAHMQVSLARLKDWFKLLSLDMDRGRFGCYTPLCQTEKWLQRWAFLEAAGERWWPVCGAVYVVSAVKRVASMTLVQPAWRKRPRQAAAQPGAVAGRELRTNRRGVDD